MLICIKNLRENQTAIDSTYHLLSFWGCFPFPFEFWSSLSESWDQWSAISQGSLSYISGIGTRPRARSRYCLAMASDHWNSLLQLLLMAMGRQMLRASLGQSPHGVPGWQNNGLLLHHGQDLLGHVLLVHHHLVHVLGEPVIGHDQVTWGENSITAQSHCRKAATDKPHLWMMH